jgi:hypothetical protein
METNQPTNVGLKTSGHKLRSGVNWQEALKKKSLK